MNMVRIYFQILKVNQKYIENVYKYMLPQFQSLKWRGIVF